MKTIKLKLAVFVSSFIIALFCYATVSKMLDFENFQDKLMQASKPMGYGEYLTNFPIIIEEGKNKKWRKTNKHACFSNWNVATFHE